MIPVSSSEVKQQPFQGEHREQVVPVFWWCRMGVHAADVCQETQRERHPFVHALSTDSWETPTVGPPVYMRNSGELVACLTGRLRLGPGLRPRPWMTLPSIDGPDSLLPSTHWLGIFIFTLQTGLQRVKSNLTKTPEVWNLRNLANFSD